MAIKYTKTLDLAPLDKFKAEMKKASKSSVDYGIFGGTHPDGEPLADVAASFEFGTIYDGDPTPPRPFLRQPVHKELEKQIEKETLPYDIATGFNLDGVLTVLGDTSVFLVKAYFDSQGFGTWKGNGAKWSAVKMREGAPREPGFYTKTLYNSLTYRKNI